MKFDFKAHKKERSVNSKKVNTSKPQYIIYTVVEAVFRASELGPNVTTVLTLGKLLVFRLRLCTLFTLCK